MKRQLSEIEALLNEKYFESKIDMIPASLKTIYSAVGGKDVLVARELIINDRVMLGVEYTPDGLIAGAYTTDKNGRRVRVESNYEKTEANRTPHNLISERLDEVAKTLAREERERKNDASSLAPEKPAPKAVAQRKLSEDEIRRMKQMEEYNKNRRGAEPVHRCAAHPIPDTKSAVRYRQRFLIFGNIPRWQTAPYPNLKPVRNRSHGKPHGYQLITGPLSALNRPAKQLITGSLSALNRLAKQLITGSQNSLNTARNIRASDKTLSSANFRNSAKSAHFTV